MRVAVLGCGPAGLLAVHAAKLAGYHVDCYSKDEKSVMGGAQYLHAPIPHLTNPAKRKTITFVKVGTRKGYAEKVYGKPDAPCSWDLFKEGPKSAWPIVAMYDMLWALYSHKIAHAAFGHRDSPLADIVSDYDVVFSTIPARVLCVDPEHHFFNSQHVVFTGGYAAKEPLASFENVVVYNGDLSKRWYRTSRIFGVEQTEYAGHHTEELNSIAGGKDVLHGFKPINTNCDCNPKIIRLGRFGQWKKGILVHTAYKGACDALHAL